MTKIPLNIFPLLLVFILGSTASLRGQQTKVAGQITDEQGQGLPFATIHEKNTTNGTTSNALGFYTLELKGANATMVFQYVGYKTIEKTPDATSNYVELNIQMVPEVVMLDALVVQPGAEDPAYGIIRQAIAQRKYHLQEINNYHCNVYIKGLQRLDQVPEKILGLPVTVDTGIVYLSESVSELSFERPGKIREQVISSKVSGDNRAFSFNQASDLLISFYENQIYSEGLSERTFISPIAENALLFYDYELIGVIMENGQVINKIQVIPKRDHDPSFSGLIYIIDQSWRLHSVDLLLTREHQIEFVDSLRIKQVMAPVDQQGKVVWTLLSQQFDFLLNAFGFKGNGYFVGVYRDYQVNRDFPRGYFSQEIVAVDVNSNQKDSAYWDSTRPIPLTDEEVSDYRVKDSIQVIKETRHYQDSVDRKNNRVTPTHVFLTGKTFRNSYRDQSWNFPSLLELIQFNTVEGFVPHLQVAFTKRYEDYRFYRLTPEARYGFSNNRFSARLSTRYYYDPLKFASVRLSGGSFVESLNPESPLKPFDNTYYSLVNGKNFLKIYQKSFVRAQHDSELFNGFYLQAALEWTHRRPLQNTTDYTFKNRNETDYTPNNPENMELASTSFLDHQALVWDLEITWQPGQKYIKRPYRKFIIQKTYPALKVAYQAAFPRMLGTDVDFQKIAVQITHDFKLGLWGSGLYFLEMGGFLKSDSISFVDFKHFNGNRTVFGHFDGGNFQLLDYYLFSTAGTYYQGHYEHHFNGFIINKIPFLRKTKIQALAAANFLHTEAAGSYWELGLGVEHIFKILRIDYYNSWLSGTHRHQGVRLGLGF